MTQLFRQLFYIFLILIALTSCSDNQLPQLDSGDTILAFGDSLTLGVGATQRQAYPAQLQELTQIKVINAGISGETTTQGLARFQQTIEKYQPQLIILLEGGNDILRNQDLTITKQNLAKMIELAQAAQINLILIGVPEKKLFSNSAPFYQELADEYQLVYEDELLSDLLKTSQYKSDMVHLNAKGYLALASGIKTILEEHGAIK